MVDNMVESQGSNGVRLTKAEHEVYLFLKDFCTINEITSRRKTSRQATYKIVHQLIKKGLINSKLKLVESSTTTRLTTRLTEGQVRLHAMQYSVGILHQSEQYKAIKKKNTIFYKDHTVNLYDDSVQVYINKDFLADNVEKAEYEGLAYGKRILMALEPRLKVTLVKDGYQNISLVMRHYEFMDNGVAKHYNRQGDKLRVYSDTDGKLRLVIDKSLNGDGLEALHPQTGSPDAKKIEYVLKDILNSEKRSIGDVINVVGLLAEGVYKLAQSHQQHMQETELTAKVLNSLVQLIASQQPAPQEAKGSPVEPKEQRKVSEYIG